MQDLKKLECLIEELYDAERAGVGINMQASTLVEATVMLAIAEQLQVLNVTMDQIRSEIVMLEKIVRNK